MAKDFLTTGEVAALCAVTPDAVLKWIKAGKIPATRTPGGHYRIHRSVIPLDLIEKQMPPQGQKQKRPFQYCWEFHAKAGEVLEECRSCIVYRCRARRGYDMVQLPKEVGHAMKFCTESCENCDYYKMVKGQRYNVLVVTDRPALRTIIEEDVADVNYNLAFTDSEYHCSIIINDYRPDFVVIDCAIGKKRYYELARHLTEDPRIPVARVILAGEKCEFSKECDKAIFALIKPDFTASELADLIENLSQ